MVTAGIVELQPASVVAVMLYVTVPVVAPVVLSVCVIDVPEPAASPVVPEDVTVQL